MTLGEAGLVSSYAEAPSTTSAKAGAGAVSSDGAIGLDDISSDDMTANVDLTRLLGQLGVDGLTDQIIDEASLEIGALGSTADKTDGTLDRQYLVAGASATVSSPAVEGLTGSLGSVVDGLGDTLNTTLSVDGALGTIVSQLEALSIPLGLLGTLGVTEASVGLEGLAAALDQVKNDVLTGVITTNTGLVSIDLGSGDVTVDLAQITTGGLNGKTPNYEVLSPTAVQEIADEITLALSNLITDLRDTLVAALDEIDIVVNLGVNLGLVDGTADITGSVASFLGLVETDPTTVVDLDVLGLDLGAVVTPLLEGVTGIVGGAVGTAINPMINGLAGTITGIVEDVTEPLEPVVEGVLNEIVEITVNEQGSTAIYDPITDTESTEAGDYVAALSVTLLPAMGHSANKISFARSEVRAADEASVIITSPETGAQIPEGEVVTVEGTAEPGKTITVTLDDLTREDIVDEDGTWTVDFEGVTPGEKTAVATDGDDDDASTDEVSFSIVVSNTNENTADNTAENTDANTEANTDVNTADNADANTDANTD
ncbi:choice-of-anchor G family protein, partial [Glutamicibacter arilaitensis]|uniref:choice-of-anchor G family protein n=1 Tax=Glutamicibacter arilaitensis TaxID=256701 RepID=UPI003FD58AD6